MSELKRTELSVQAERALLVTVVLPESNVDPRDPIGELRSLVKTAGALVVDEMLAKRKKIHPGYYVGLGKAEEIAARVEMNEVDVVIFDNDLSPAQVRDLEEIIGVKILDRSELILDIFAAHARTYESRLQVELAQLQYTYPRLRHMWTHLDRSVGAAAVGGVGTRGPGEKQIETDRRIVQQRKSYLQRKIADIDKRKVRQVRGRGDMFSACLVGYTNAGKSTLMGLATGEDVYIADQLFATLDTRTRRWDLTDGQFILLSDTVGFVRDLPHHLVASFRATLEEAIGADLLVHVADASHERVVQQIEAVETVLEELGCGESEQLLVLNKIDRITDPTIQMVLGRKYPRALFISAARGDGSGELVREVALRCGGAPIRVSLRADCANGKLMQYIQRHATIESQEYDGSIACIEAVMPTARVDQLGRFAPSVTVDRQDDTPDHLAAF